MSEEKLKMTAETVNALHDAIGALVYALTLDMPKEKRGAFSKTLARLAQSKTSGGAILAGTILLDFATAADLAAKVL